MANEIDFDEVLRKYKADPYDYIDVRSIHAGVVTFAVEEGGSVDAPSGEWKHIPGTTLYAIERERNSKEVHSQINGTIASINAQCDGRFVEAGEKLMTIRHPLKKKGYYRKHPQRGPLSLSGSGKGQVFLLSGYPGAYRQKGCPVPSPLNTGGEIITMSLMKRDTPVYYRGLNPV